MELPQLDDYRQLFLDDVPLLDVRAPVEFKEGAFPEAVNHPLINDEERHEIGICYKEHGQASAIQLGHELVKGKTREQRIEAWQQFASDHPEGVLYCFRGGMRSQISQQWLNEEAGILYPRVRGGYKAMRRFLLKELEVSASEIKPLVVGGKTGVGKTIFLQQFQHAIDLEAMAWHRGSAFGRHATPQPTQIDFENTLSIALIKHRNAGNQPVLVEDESRTIGSKHIPEILFTRLKSSPLLLLEASVEERVSITLQEYVVEALQEYQHLHGEEAGFDLWAEYLLGSLDKIQRRLGGLRHRHLQLEMKSAIEWLRRSGDPEPHRGWIETLLVHYYDPMYEYQIGRNADRIVVQGDTGTLADYIRDRGLVPTR